MSKCNGITDSDGKCKAQLTPYHAKYFAYELTKRCSSDSLQKLAVSLSDAQVDLNPHQVEAALFAFRSPLSKGAILADEVGLGKTIEAGILLSQKWAERKRKILIILPSNLRKQWNQELLDKFFLPTVILETQSFNQEVKRGNLNPFEQKDIVICSYHFARAKDAYIKQINWDLVVIDEAHRLRNVYKTSNKIANAIKGAVAHCPKLLLTATPLQNSLMELYGLVSIIDDYTFGDLKSFKSQFARLTNEDNFDDLKERLKPICKRTLRRQVLEYVKYTNRIPITQEFIPTAAEQKLYDLVSEYLQSPNLYALPPSQRQLMTLILRKLLASSTYAISGTLETLANKLGGIVENQENLPLLDAAISEDFETLDELKDEWSEEDEEAEEPKVYTPEELKSIKEEIVSLKQFSALANSIRKNSKGEVLLQALKAGFAEAEKRGGSKKAIIFTESTRTQRYLNDILEQTEYRGKIVLFNGSNNDPKSREIYRNWVEQHQGTDRITGSKTADMRAALVDYFRDEAVTMIATERENPFSKETIYPGPYRIGKNVEDANIYRIGHPLAQRIVEKCKAESLPNQELVFKYSQSGKKISILESLVGKTGWLSLINLTINSFETEDNILFCGITDDGNTLDIEQCRRMFSLPSTIKPLESDIIGKNQEQIDNIAYKQKADILQGNSERNAGFLIMKWINWTSGPRM